MINCLAIDDETPALDILEDNIRRVPFLQLVGKCKNAYAAMEALQQQPVDLLFLDIEMPGISGLHFLKCLPGRPMVIFITAYRNYAVEGFDLDVLDYLVKPVAFDRFLRAVNRALEYQGFKQREAADRYPEYFFVHTEYQLVKVAVQDILFIEALRNYIRIHLSGTAKPILSKMSLKAIEERLPPEQFAKVHRSFIVMLARITSIRNDIICIGQRDIPLGRGCRDEFYRRINEIK